MRAGEAHIADQPRLSEPRSHLIFYSIFLPIGAIANLVLGLVVLSGLKIQNDLSWLELGTGAICCMIAGWLAATAWSRSYWNRNMARQVAVWRRIADAFFAWLEEAPLPADALRNLQSSIEEVVPSSTGK